MAEVEASVKCIQRIQNQHLWRKYYNERNHVAKKNGGFANEMELFHGSRGTPPHEIYNGEEGFDMRFSAPGMWGLGIYFASSPRYSKNYAHPTARDGTLQIFLAKVIVGAAYYCPPNSTLRTPPAKKQPTNCNSNSIPAATEYYDSVEGDLSPGKAHIVYSNSKAYPTYLITFEGNAGTRYSTAPTTSFPFPQYPPFAPSQTVGQLSAQIPSPFPSVPTARRSRCTARRGSLTRATLNRPQPTTQRGSSNRTIVRTTASRGLSTRVTETARRGSP